MAHRILTGLAVIVLVGGCSTRPREFRAQLATAAPDQSAFERDLQICQVMVRKGVRSNFARTAAQVGGGTVVGLAAGVGAGAIATSAAAPSLAAAFGLPALNAAAATFTFVGPLAGFGISRMIRSSREKKYKAALGTCLTEYGYTASGWEKQKKLNKKDRARIIASLKAAGAPKLEDAPSANEAPILGDAAISAPAPQVLGSTETGPNQQD